MALSVQFVPSPKIDALSAVTDISAADAEEAEEEDDGRRRQ